MQLGIAIGVAALLSGCTGGGPPPNAGSTTPPAPTPSATSSPKPSATSSPQPSASGSPRPSGSPASRLCDTVVESSNPVLRGVRFGRHATFDRLAFDFCKPADTTLTATLVKELIQDGSGERVRLDGKYFYALRLSPADAHTSAGKPTVTNKAVTVAGRNMQQYRLIGDFEGVVTYGVGFRRLAPTATAMNTDPTDPRHVVYYFDLGPQKG